MMKMMQKHNLTIKKLATIFVVLIAILSMGVVPSAQACTRLLYQQTIDSKPITGRSMDWFEFPDTKLWFFEKGIQRNGKAGDNSVEWKSKYDSIVNASYDLAMVDGINDQGLVVNLLVLASTNYGQPGGNKKNISLGGWGQYVLDNYKNVDETVACLTKNIPSSKKELGKATTCPTGVKDTPLHIVTANLGQLKDAGVIGDIPLSNDFNLSLHMALSDKTGNSAILEYVEGKLVVHQNKDYDVLTNDPIFEEQRAINTYWYNLYKPQILCEGLAGLSQSIPVPPVGFLPGSTNASDRFVRAKYYLDKMEEPNQEKIASMIIQQCGKPLDSTPPPSGAPIYDTSPKAAAPLSDDEARRNELAGVLGIVRNASDPIGLAITPDLSNPADLPAIIARLGTTQWRTVSNQDEDDLSYYFEYTRSPNVIWASMKDLQESTIDPEKKAKVLESSKIDLGSGKNKGLDHVVLVGNVSDQFKDKIPFDWNICTINTTAPECQTN
ncbi:linear amide C-N hydrolase [Dapis sp. BLCC M229]|uniref:linear amide C-N hydrolase n=1 Tax=Dapis sp. BLCC M229 TaxID=3400188 RepID=UPI003CF47523